MVKRSITIRFYEELNDFLKNYPLKQDIDFTFSGKRSVKDLIESFGVPHVEVDLILVNGEPVDFEYALCDGDRISVYPMFERLNIQSASHLKKPPLRVSRFVLDVHLGKLAKHLRLLGFDTDYSRDRGDKELAEISAEENRILLTRDRQLLMRKIVQRGLIIRSDYHEEQLLEVLDKIDLWESIKPFTRCMSCNGLLVQLPMDCKLFNQLKNAIPEGVISWCSEYNYCRSCLKVYWKGSHYEELLQRIERFHDTL